MVEDRFWGYMDLYIVKGGGEFDLKCEKIWFWSGSDILEIKGRGFREEEGMKSGKFGDCFDCICF